jgi:hypothetical protein
MNDGRRLLRLVAAAAPDAFAAADRRDSPRTGRNNRGRDSPARSVRRTEEIRRESRHRAVGHDEVEIRLEEIEQIEGAEGEASRCDPHEQECQPCGPMKEPVKQPQKRHRSTQFPALVARALGSFARDGSSLPASKDTNLKLLRRTRSSAIGVDARRTRTSKWRTRSRKGNGLQKDRRLRADLLRVASPNVYLRALSRASGSSGRNRSHVRPFRVPKGRSSRPSRCAFLRLCNWGPNDETKPVAVYPVQSLG